MALTNVRSANPDATVAINANEGLGMPALIRQARQMRIRGELVTAVGTIAPSVIQVAGEAANGIVGADIYFPDVEPFASNPGQPSLRAPTSGDVPHDPRQVHGPRRHRAAGLGDGREGGQEPGPRGRGAARSAAAAFRDTIMGEATFGPDGQLQSRHALFTVQDQKIVVRR